jgi:hypothetical protein
MYVPPLEAALCEGRPGLHMYVPPLEAALCEGRPGLHMYVPPLARISSYRESNS